MLFSIILLAPSIYNGWVYWDDPTYVLENDFLVIKSFDDIIAMFSLQFVQGNYHPLTILSLALDYSIDGINPIVFHTTNLFFHIANAALVYLFVFKLFRIKSIAFFVSLLFAIHPMHVESFAWVSERKDVLYVFFFILGLIQYLNYQKKENLSSYFLCLLFFILSLFSKGMAVVFPVVMILLDYLQKREFNRRVILEKIPFFVLSLIFGLIVLWAQEESNAISSDVSHPLSQAFLIPIHGLLIYLIKAVIPYNLSALHPYPMMLDGKTPFQILYSFIPLLLLFTGVILFFRKNRKVVFGFAFFVLVIFPVLQFLSVGSAMISERFTYLPYIGLFIVLAVILQKEFSKGSKTRKNTILFLTGAYIAFLSYQTHHRITIWENDETLWTDVIESYPQDYFAYMKRGSFRAKKGEFDSALLDLNKGISIFQNDYYLFNNRGMIYLSLNKFREAEQDFSKAIEIDSSLYEASLNRGLVYLNIKKYQLALSDFKRAEILAPTNDLVYLNQAILYERMDSFNLILACYEKAIELNPLSFQSYKFKGVYHYSRGQLSIALIDFEKAIQINEQYSEAYYWKAKTLRYLGKKNLAIISMKKAVKLGYRVSQEEYNNFIN